MIVLVEIFKLFVSKLTQTMRHIRQLIVIHAITGLK